MVYTVYCIYRRSDVSTPLCIFQPVILSIAGSGNTMTRLLLDDVLAPYKSGSFYHDRTLFQDLPGEYSCRHSSYPLHQHSSGQQQQGILSPIILLPIIQTIFTNTRHMRDTLVAFSRASQAVSSDDVSLAVPHTQASATAREWTA